MKGPANESCLSPARASAPLQRPRSQPLWAPAPFCGPRNRCPRFPEAVVHAVGQGVHACGGEGRQALPDTPAAVRRDVCCPPGRAALSHCCSGRQPGRCPHPPGPRPPSHRNCDSIILKPEWFEYCSGTGGVTLGEAGACCFSPAPSKLRPPLWHILHAVCTSFAC